MPGIKLPSREELSLLSSAEAAEVAAHYLSVVEAGRLPLPLFKEIGRLMSLSTVEVTPLRHNADSLEVLLTQRPESDPWWAGQWHLPGTVIIDSDLGEDHGPYGYATVLDRLYSGELGESVTVGESVLFDAHLRRGVRGPEQTVFHWAPVDLAADYSELPTGRFFDATSVADNPPDGGLIIGHAESIRRATAHYTAYSTLPSGLRDQLFFSN